MTLKPIPDYPDYFASDDGNIYSMKPSGVGSKPPSEPRLMKKNLRGNRSGYYCVELCTEGCARTYNVSYLVLVAFVSPRPKGMFACHGIGGQHDDSLDNLYWGTPSQNNGIDKVRDGTNHYAVGEKNGRVKLNEMQVRVIRRAYSFGGKFGLAFSELALVFGVGISSVRRVVSRESWKHI